MTLLAGWDVLGKRTAMCGVEAEGKIGRGGRHTPLDDRRRLEAFWGKLAKVGLKSGPFTPQLFRARGDLLSNGMHGPGRPMHSRADGSRATRPTPSVWPRCCGRAGFRASM